MKKIIIALLLAMMLVACSNKSNDANISDGNTVIWEGQGKKYTSNDLNKYAKANDYSAFIINDALIKIAKLENMDVDAITKEAEETYDNYIESGLESYINYYYLNKDNFIKSFVSNEVIEKQIENTIESDFDTYVNEKLPYKAEIVYFDDKEVADKVIEEASKGDKTFAEICTENGYTDAINAQVYLDNDETLPVEVKETIQNKQEPGLSQIIISSTVITDENGESIPQPRYYIVNLVSKNANEFKDEFMDLIKQDFESDTIINDLLVKYNFECHDQTTYELLHSKYEGVK